MNWSKKEWLQFAAMCAGAIIVGVAYGQMYVWLLEKFM